MRESRESHRVVHAVIARPRIDGASVADLYGAVENGAREIVFDVGESAEIDDEALELLVWLARRLEDAGGRLSLTARGPEGVRVTGTLRAGDPACVAGVHWALDKAILRRLTVGAGGAAPC
jgi:hypothetical protein